MKITKHVLLWLLAPLLALHAASTDKQKGSGITVLDDTMQHIYIAYGIATTVRFPGDVDINEVSFGNPGFEVVKYLKSETVPNSFSLFAQVQTGSVNMNVTVNGKTYVFMVHIVDDSRVNYTKSYTLSGLSDSRKSSKVSRAPTMSPAEIDVANAIKIIEKSRVDHVYANSLSKDIQWHKISKSYQWNDNIITLYDAVHFLDDDLIVLTVAWSNRSNDTAYYLNVQQYQVFLSNEKIYPTASTQITDTVFPGQMDIAYLFIQGHKLDVRQDWNIKLPPEEKEIMKIR